jgi:hypothetical protein
MGRTKQLGTGTVVWIPSELGGGIFPTERQVRIEVEDGARETILGFVPSQDVRPESATRGRVRAVVLESTEERVAVLLRGDLLSGSNPILVPRTWLLRVGRFE